MNVAALPDLGQVRVAVIGLGYVGLPLAVAFGRRYPTLGFDINGQRVGELRRGHDHTLECSPDPLRPPSPLRLSHHPAPPQA